MSAISWLNKLEIWVAELQVKTLLVKFTLDTPTGVSPSKMRGAVAAQFEQYILLHHHFGQLLLYRYPMIQYKFLGPSPTIVGINEGADLLHKIHYDLDRLTIRREEIKIIGKNLIFRSDDYRLSSQPISYSFLTPWLALNEKNYEQYMKFGTWSERKELLENILIGNILSVSKSLGYTVAEPIKVEIGKMHEVKTRLKDVPMIGFLGTFSVNFEIPDYWGLGKSVSRGFGTLIKCNSL